MRRTLGSLMLSAALLAPAGLFLTSPAFAAPKHQDTFIPGAGDEGRVVQEVRHQLAMLPYYTIFDDLGFQVQGSTVILEGAVTNPVLKSDAENTVKHVEGVTGVTNNIEVLPLSPMDWQVRRAVARAIYGDATIGDRYGFQALPSIHIIVKNGNVVLEGIVSNTFDKNLIGVRANGVPNVFHVSNNLVVENGK